MTTTLYRSGGAPLVALMAEVRRIGTPCALIVATGHAQPPRWGLPGRVRVHRSRALSLDRGTHSAGNHLGDHTPGSSASAVSGLSANTTYQYRLVVITTG